MNNLTLKEITDTVVSINLENDNFYECKNKITNLSINSADNIRVNFKSFISFTTDNIENTKATQIKKRRCYQTFWLQQRFSAISDTKTPKLIYAIYTQ